jgi:hypothetical protein
MSLLFLVYRIAWSITCCILLTIIFYEYLLIFKSYPVHNDSSRIFLWNGDWIVALRLKSESFEVIVFLCTKLLIWGVFLIISESRDQDVFLDSSFLSRIISCWISMGSLWNRSVSRISVWLVVDGRYCEIKSRSSASVTNRESSSGNIPDNYKISMLIYISLRFECIAYSSSVFLVIGSLDTVPSEVFHWYRYCQ